MKGCRGQRGDQSRKTKGGGEEKGTTKGCHFPTVSPAVRSGCSSTAANTGKGANFAAAVVDLDCGDVIWQQDTGLGWGAEWHPESETFRSQHSCACAAAVRIAPQREPEEVRREVISSVAAKRPSMTQL